MFATILMAVGCSQHDAANPQASKPSQIQIEAMTVLTNEHYVGLTSVVSELAAKNWMDDETNGKITVLALHTNNFNVAKYTDGKYLVISLPIINPEDVHGFCKFVKNYNAFNIKKADLLAKDGKYAEAKGIYEVVMHFDPWPCDRTNIEYRLSLLDKLDRHVDVEANRQKFLAEFIDLGSLTPWAQVSGVNPTAISNVLTLPVATPLKKADDWW
jgi:hypothetical protein